MTTDKLIDPVVRPGSTSSDKRAELLTAFRRVHNRWLGGRDNPDAGPLMLCFTYAGGSTGAFRGWEDMLPVNVRPIVLPGRDGRIDEPAYTRLSPLIADLVEYVGPHVTPDTVFFGHSMGALVAFEFTRELRRRGMTVPKKLLLAAFRAPHLESDRKPIHGWPDDVLQAVLHREGVPAATLTNPQIMAALLPTLRADLELCETYEFADESPLEVPLAVFGGSDDVRVRPPMLRGWDRHTSQGATHVTVNGPHLFINVSRDELLAAVQHELHAMVGDHDVN
ncbi:thioesterase II family protein [Rhodococcoides navarretei]|uniref:Thioesterase TesA n=1 Tax=Rhodococcus navarretei TaxID=3128981 RepID=A0ABU9CQA4_9NOCA